MRAQRRSETSEKGIHTRYLRANSLRIGTGNFVRPCRELNQAIREFIRLIREAPLDLLYLRRVLGSSRATANDLDRLFHALADPARRVVVERLSRGPAAVSELARPLAMSLPAAMQHLGVLELARVGGR